MNPAPPIAPTHRKVQPDTSAGPKVAGSREILAASVAIVLNFLPLRNASAEDRVEAKYLWYAEEHGRVDVSGPSFFAEKEITPWLNLRLEGVYNAVSGATPTGEPAGRRTTQIEVSQTTTTTETVAKKVFHSVSGPSGRTTRAVGRTVSQQVTKSVTSTHTETIVLADNPHLPTQELTDERYGANLLLSAKLGPGVLGVSYAYSTERDYQSSAGALKWTQDFNQKNTVLDAGFAYAHDDADLFYGAGAAGKDTYDGHLGLTQIVDKFTIAEFHASVSSAHGYLNDQYKVVLLGEDIVPEKRPSSRVRATFGLDLKRYVAPLGGSIAAGYRFGTDTFGITSHEASLTWSQKLGAAWTLVLGGRGYVQSAADFYAVSFTGNPDHYSADYRLSSLYSASGEARVVWKARENLSFDVGYERYAMHGRDHATSGEAYPTANVISAGVQLWF